MTPEHWRKDETGRAEERQMASWTPRRCHLQAPGAWLDGHKGGDALQQPVSKSWRQESLHPCSRALGPTTPLGHALAPHPVRS